MFVCLFVCFIFPPAEPQFVLHPHPAGTVECGTCHMYQQINVAIHLADAPYHCLDCLSKLNASKWPWPAQKKALINLCQALKITGPAEQLIDDDAGPMMLINHPAADQMQHCLQPCPTCGDKPEIIRSHHPPGRPCAKCQHQQQPLERAERAAKRDAERKRKEPQRQNGEQARQPPTAQAPIDDVTRAEVSLFSSQTADFRLWC